MARRGVVGGPALLGTSTQAIFGSLWNHAIGRDSRLEVLIYVGAWLLLGVACSRWRKGGSEPKKGPGFSLSENVVLCFLLAAAFCLRALHPLQHWALGQSDAYSHLQLIRDVLVEGHIRNAVYPSGYAWVMGFPAIAFNLDPYIVVRYGGACFGVLLVLAVYVLVRELSASAAAGLIAGFLAGCCPFLNLLHKTAVGAFANQMGLFLIPVSLFFCFRWRENEFRWNTDAVAVGLATAALSVSVPMMLIHVFILFGLERLTAMGKGRSNVWSGVGRLACMGLLSVLLTGYHLRCAGSSNVDTSLLSVLDEKGTIFCQ